MWALDLIAARRSWMMLGMIARLWNIVLQSRVTRPARCAQTRVTAIGIGVTVLLAAGCGGNQTAAPASPVTNTAPITNPETTTTAASTAPSVPTGPPLTQSNQQTYHVKSADGYTATLTLTAYDLAHVSSIPALPYSARNVVDDSCQVYDGGLRSVDASRDAVIPMTFTLTYTTSGFSSPLSLGLIGDLGAFDMSADNCVIGYQANQFPIVRESLARSPSSEFVVPRFEFSASASRRFRRSAARIRASALTKALQICVFEPVILWFGGSSKLARATKGQPASTLAYPVAGCGGAAAPRPKVC
jgi:hypothetical protein